MWRSQNKYRAKKKEYKGRLYHSGREADEAMWLDMLLKQGKLKEVQPQHKLILDIDGRHITTHIVDFLITLPDGRQKFMEVKGFATELWRVKMKITEAIYPDIPYLVNPNERELLD